jgi:hypothetical protein
MAYKKFDDPIAKVEDAPNKVANAFPAESLRRAIQSITNRIISGTDLGTMGNQGTAFNVGCGTGSTAGVAITYGVTLAINGRMGTLSAQDNLYLPKGTQSSNTWVKYLIAAKFGANGTVVAGNEGASSTAARLPNCPDGYVAVGYMEYATTSGAFIRFGGRTAGMYNIVASLGASTCGTVIAFKDLLHMPYDEA